MAVVGQAGLSFQRQQLSSYQSAPSVLVLIYRRRRRRRNVPCSTALTEGTPTLTLTCKTPELPTGKPFPAYDRSSLPTSCSSCSTAFLLVAPSATDTSFDASSSPAARSPLHRTCKVFGELCKWVVPAWGFPGGRCNLQICSLARLGHRCTLAFPAVSLPSPCPASPSFHIAGSGSSLHTCLPFARRPALSFSPMSLLPVFKANPLCCLALPLSLSLTPHLSRY